MNFHNDNRMATDAGPIFGKYLVTFDSVNSQVRADLFQRGRNVTAYVTFPSGLDATRATDPYYEHLVDYATSQGFRDAFRIVYS